MGPNDDVQLDLDLDFEEVEAPTLDWEDPSEAVTPVYERYEDGSIKIVEAGAHV